METETFQSKHLKPENFHKSSRDPLKHTIILSDRRTQKIPCHAVHPLKYFFKSIYQLFKEGS